MSNDKVLELDHVSHAFDGGMEVLHDVSLAVEPGEILCLLGPSGCGKTTSLRLAAGLEECQRGRVMINGRVVSDGRVHVPPEDRGIGMVFQDTALFPHLTVAQNIGFGLSQIRDDRREARIKEMLHQVSMDGYADSFPHVLSGGQQQRVALARALAPEPNLVLLDEPFSGLDAQLRALIREESLALLKAHGATTLVVTHDPEEAMYVSDRIVVMNAGRVEQIGRPDEIYCHPVNIFVTRFFSSTNRLTRRVADGRVTTPFGPLDAPKGTRDGDEVLILIRPEALRIGRAAGGATGAVQARVETARMLRRAIFMQLRIPVADGEDLHFHARDPGHQMPAEGSEVMVTLDPQQTFVFPQPKT